MFDERKRRVADRIVSIAQAKAPVKYDVSVDENGHARLEKASFDAYSECTVLKDVVENYKKRTGRYPKGVLADRAYRTKENRAYCEERGIAMSGRKPGRPPEDDKERRRAEKAERKNDVDRIEVERFFSRDKRRFGAGLIMTRLSSTTLGSIALAVLVANLFGAGLSFLSFISWTRQSERRLSISWRCRTMPRRAPDARTRRAPWRRKACTLGKISPLTGRH